LASFTMSNAQLRRLKSPDSICEETKLSAIYDRY